MKLWIIAIGLLIANAALGSFVIPDNAVTTIKILNGAVSRPKLAALGQQLSVGVTSITTVTGTTITLVANTAVTITTTGRPIWIFLQPIPNTNAFLECTPTANTQGCSYYIYRGAGATQVARFSVTPGVAVNTTTPGSLFVMDPEPAGTYRYDLYMNATNAGSAATVDNVQLVAYEL